jgi:CheY-like chemotaxis protein
MSGVLICASEAVLQQLNGSAVCREGLERQRATSAGEAIAAAASGRPKLVVIDRDLPAAEFLVRQLRGNAATRGCSIVIVADGDMSPDELGLLTAGANAVLRLPPGPEWDARIEPLLHVPTRKETRLTTDLVFTANFQEQHVQGRVANLSSTGMLVESAVPLPIGGEVQFRFELPGFETSTGEITGVARVVRVAGPKRYGMMFSSFDSTGKELLRRYLLVP